MDYFTELLDSYKKLKKRTFKLQYMVEQANPAVDKANELIANADTNQREVTNVAGSPVGLKIYRRLATERKPEAVMVMGLGSQGGIVTVQGGNNDEKWFDAFVARLGGGRRKNSRAERRYG